jgi:predicted nucleic acid-binding protein
VIINVKVVDASALAALLFQEFTAAEVALQLQSERLIAPALIDIGIANVCLMKLRRKQASPDLLIAAFTARYRIMVERMDVDTNAVFALAITTGLTAYDASYLWLAQTYNAELVTLDKQLAKAAASQ